MKAETRITPFATSLEPPNRLTGYAAKFGEPSAILYDDEVCKGPFVEVIEPGAFTNSLRDHPDVRALYNHSTSAVLARTRSGTMTLVEDDVGLHFDLTLPDTTHGRDARVLVERKDIDGCSFGFFCLEDRIEKRGKGEPSVRHIIEAHVFEITPATAFPAYTSTSVNLRSRRLDAADPPTSRPRLDLARSQLRYAST
jgi:hypothetical protein